MTSGEKRGKRTSIFDYVSNIEKNVTANKYCAKSDLTNEASVESFFVLRLLKDLSYEDRQIKTKESVAELTVSLGGRKTEPYKPDYVLVIADTPRWLLDAKATDENVDKWIPQCSGYSIAINRKYRGEKPLQYYAITNGLEFKLFKWDEDEPVLSLTFAEFFDDNQKFIALRNFLEQDVARRGWKNPKDQKHATITLIRPEIGEVKKIFNQSHRLIWKAEKMGDPVPAFFEFVKIMFVKLWEDRKLHESLETAQLIQNGQPIPVEKVVFSRRWIENNESENNPNPVDKLLFQPLAKKFDESVARRDKKPVFKENEVIRLHAGTVKEVVKKLEKYDLFGIDNDLNGRLFEAFLSATMRGEHLGQYFTPRSIAKLATRLANPTVRIVSTDASKPILERAKIERCADACCGTGGFLIEVLTVMRNQIREMTSLTEEDRDKLIGEVADNSVFGIDVAMEPPLARIARINMYLHGDGGSRIYAMDALDKEIPTEVADSTQVKLELEEFHKLILEDQFRFDLATTNPPFSMDYSQNLPYEERILKHYKLLTYDLEDTSKARSSLRSSIMFLERYWDLLNPHGRLITVIDDSVLSGKKYAFARKFIREKFIIRAIISLHGDAFQRVGARAKTSIIYLVKKEDNEMQPDAFMMESQYVGLDDVPRTTPESKAKLAKDLAEKESNEIVENFGKFLRGEKGTWLVPASNFKDRLDVKSCLPRRNDVVQDWLSQGFEVLPLEKIVKPVEETINTRSDPQKLYTFLRITYTGTPQEGEKRSGKEITYDSLTPVRENDLAVSNIAVMYGSISVVPKELEHTFVSSEFTLMRVVDSRFDPYFLCGFLRSSEVRARLLSKSTGISRHRAGWEFLKDIPVPLVGSNEQKRISELYKEAISSQKNALEKERTASQALSSKLNLDNEWAVKRLKAAKPPK